MANLAGAMQQAAAMSAQPNQMEIPPDWVGIVVKQVESLRFGVVQITVHDARVVQIDRTEKVRLGQNEPRGN